MNEVINDAPTTIQKGECMKKSYLTIALTMTSLLGLNMSARAQDASKLTVAIPFEFVAGGQNLPAGTYGVGRVSPDSNPGLIIRSYGNSALLLPVVVDETSGEGAKLGFERVGAKYFLRTIETPVGVYTIAMPRLMAELVQKKNDGTASSPGSN
jgi:hypothetical protein